MQDRPGKVQSEYRPSRPNSAADKPPRPPGAAGQSAFVPAPPANPDNVPHRSTGPPSRCSKRRERIPRRSGPANPPRLIVRSPKSRRAQPQGNPSPASSADTTSPAGPRSQAPGVVRARRGTGFGVVMSGRASRGVPVESPRGSTIRLPAMQPPISLTPLRPESRLVPRFPVAAPHRSSATASPWPRSVPGIPQG